MTGLVLRDAQAILVYLAAKYDASATWYPRDDAALLGEISQWLAFADAITATASAARLHDGLFYDLDIDAARAGAHRLFRILDEHLWFGEQEEPRLDLLGRSSDHRRHRLLSLHHAVGRRRHIPPGLSGDPALVRPRQAHPGLHRHVGHIPCGAGARRVSRPYRQAV